MHAFFLHRLPLDHQVHQAFLHFFQVDFAGSGLVGAPGLLGSGGDADEDGRGGRRWRRSIHEGQGGAG